MTDERPDDKAADDATGAADAHPHDDDATWQALVASLRSPDPAGDAPWPEQENLRRPGAETPPAAEPPAPRPAEPVVIWRGSTADIDAEIERAVPDEHFVPPEPPPLPRADLITTAAWVGAIGAPFALLLVVALGWTPAWLMIALTVAFVGGFALLLTRLRDQHDPSDPDDGAVV
jgi:hypothetical protein